MEGGKARRSEATSANAGSGSQRIQVVEVSECRREEERTEQAVVANETMMINAISQFA